MRKSSKAEIVLTSIVPGKHRSPYMQIRKLLDDGDLIYGGFFGVKRVNFKK